MKVHILVGIGMILLIAGCVRLTDVDGNPIQMGRNEVAYFMVEEGVQEARVMKALVKGSIYETGEVVSVFGTCLDQDGLPINGTYAVMSSWYPNGTVFFSNVSMSELQEGYYLYQGAMSVVEGTYLTEIECRVNGSNMTAKAWGEWQNPAWVRKIGQINATVGNISVQLGDLQVEMNQSFEITWDKIESVNVTLGNVYQNLSNEIYIVGQIANASVDRNDSYIVFLLNQILTGIPSGNATLTWNETAGRVIYYRNWKIDVEVYDSVGDIVGWPEVGCYINTTNDPPTQGALMEFIDGQDIFRHKEKVKVKEFEWDVWCEYN